MSKSSIKSELENLQVNSWNLELLVSGFMILMLIQVHPLLREASASMNEIHSPAGGLTSFILIFVGFALLLMLWYFVFVNLVIHLLFRGFWIGLIGMRYISDGIDVKALNYSEKFEKKVRSLGSYDDYIERIEKICSVIFGITFLIMFFSLSAMLFFVYAMLLDAILSLIGDDESIFVLVVSWTFVICIAIYFLDFITAGWIKRIKRFKIIPLIYYPIYNLFSVLSLAFLYRPVLYNFISNNYGRRILFYLIPYIVIVLISIGFYLQSHDFHIEKEMATDLLEQGKVAPINFYDESRMPDKKVNFFSVPSQVIEGDYLPIFLSYNSNMDALIKERCLNENAVLKSKGLRNSFLEIFTGNKENDFDYDQFLNCYRKLHKIELDGAVFDSLTMYVHNKAYGDKRQRGFIVYLDISQKTRGKMELTISREYQKPFQSNIDTMVVKLPIFR